MSLFLIDNDHYVIDVVAEPGWHDVRSDTRYCCAIPRVELRDGWNFLFRICKPGQEVFERRYVLPDVAECSQ